VIHDLRIPLTYLPHANTGISGRRTVTLVPGSDHGDLRRHSVATRSSHSDNRTRRKLARNRFTPAQRTLLTHVRPSPIANFRRLAGPLLVSGRYNYCLVINDVARTRAMREALVSTVPANGDALDWHNGQQIALCLSVQTQTTCWLETRSPPCS
jgi:hypothetical protein